MIWLLIAAGLVFVLCLVFVLALCAAAAAGDRMSERVRRGADVSPKLFTYAKTEKRPGDVGASRGMTEDR